jgi:hypothetical protein
MARTQVQRMRFCGVRRVLFDKLDRPWQNTLTVSGRGSDAQTEGGAKGLAW